MNRRCFFGTLAGAIVTAPAAPVVPAVAQTMPDVMAGIGWTSFGCGKSYLLHPAESAISAEHALRLKAYFDANFGGVVRDTR